MDFRYGKEHLQPFLARVDRKKEETPQKKRVSLSRRF